MPPLLGAAARIGSSNGSRERERSQPDHTRGAQQHVSTFHHRSPFPRIAARVAVARERQRARYRGHRAVECNAHVAGRWLDAHGGVEPAARSLLAGAADRLALSARGYHRVLKVARTIADLAGEERVTTVAVAEALRYRPAAGADVASASTAARRPGTRAIRVPRDARPDPVAAAG